MRTREIPSLMPRSTRIEKWLCGRGKVASTNESEARRVVLFANRYRRERSFHDLFTVLVFESAHLHSLYTFINFVNSKVFEREGGEKNAIFYIDAITHFHVAPAKMINFLGLEAEDRQNHHL